MKVVKWVVQRACGIFILELSPCIQLDEALSKLVLLEPALCRALDERGPLASSQILL